jgi:hypothetical protein
VSEKCIKPGNEQQKIITMIISSLLPAIFKTELQRYVPLLMKKYNLKEQSKCIAITFPRRNGKTYALCMIIAVWICSQDEGDINLYNITGKLARLALQLIKKICKVVKEDSRMGIIEIKGGSLDSLTVITSRGTDLTAYSYPGKSHGSTKISLYKYLGVIYICERDFVI